MADDDARHKSQSLGSANKSYETGVTVFVSTGSLGGEQLLRGPAPSLGSSALSFERSLKNVAVALAFGSTMTFTHDATLAHALVPSDLEVPWADTTGTSSPLKESATSILLEESRWFKAILAAADDEQVEDGVRHPAETSLAGYIGRFGASRPAEYVLDRATPAVRSAAMLRLLGRVGGVDGLARREIVRGALESESVEVRDAAVQAAENWDDSNLAHLLRDHVDSVHWLTGYARQVARDLGG